LLVWPSTIQLKTAQFFFSKFEIKNVKGIQKVPKKFTKKWRDRWCNMETTKWKPKNGEHTTTTKLKNKQNGNQPHTHTHRKSNNKKEKVLGATHVHTETKTDK
jgi:hypothetical protein